MRPLVAIAAACMVMLALAACGVKNQDIEVRHLSWNIDGDIVPFSAEVMNTAGHRAEGTVIVVGQSRQEGNDGTQQRECGRSVFEVSLAPGENKQIAGRIPRRWGDDIAIQAFVIMGAPNKSPEATPGSVTPAASAPGAPPPSAPQR